MVDKKKEKLNEEHIEELYNDHFADGTSRGLKIDTYIQIFVLIFGAIVFILDKGLGLLNEHIPDVYYAVMGGFGMVGKRIIAVLEKKLNI